MRHTSPRSAGSYSQEPGHCTVYMHGSPPRGPDVTSSESHVQHHMCKANGNAKVAEVLAFASFELQACNFYIYIANFEFQRSF